MSTLVDEITEDYVTWSDPRWSKMRLTYRRLDYWCQVGYLRPLGEVHPGSGEPRRWPVAELYVAARMVAFINEGFVPAAAAMLARNGAERERVARVLIGSVTL